MAQLVSPKVPMEKPYFCNERAYVKWAWPIGYSFDDFTTQSWRRAYIQLSSMAACMHLFFSA